MGKIKSIYSTYSQSGTSGIRRLICRRLYSKSRPMLLFEKNWKQEPEFVNQEDTAVTCREGVPTDIEKIVESWPIEFAGIASDAAQCRKLLQNRFEVSMPCYIAIEGKTVLALSWCKPWIYDRALPLNLQNREAYEIFNLFTVNTARGKGVAGKLLIYLMDCMANKGYTVAYSRIMPERKASIRAHEKLGFKPLGLLTSGYTLGRYLCRLDGSRKNIIDMN